MPEQLVNDTAMQFPHVIATTPRHRVWPWAVGAALALFAVLWMRSSGGTIEPQLMLDNSNGRITYTGVVRDAATRNAINDTLRKTYGQANLAGDVLIDRRVKPVQWPSHLAELFAAAHVPGTGVTLTGNAVGTGATVVSYGAAAEAILAANRNAIDLSGAVGTAGTLANATSVVDAMNLAAINFASGSARLPSGSMAVIQKSAQAISRAPSGTVIEIGGHTDSTGEPAVNMALSQARADAVKAALVRNGVPSAMLVARGYGDTEPRATNNTEHGRFQNRRIEYAMVQK